MDHGTLDKALPDTETRLINDLKAGSPDAIRQLVKNSWGPLLVTAEMILGDRHLPGMITCGEFEQFVVDYLDNNLEGSQLKAFERHLKICPECIDYIKHYKQTLELASRTMETNGAFYKAGNPPEDLITAILDAQDRKYD